MEAYLSSSSLCLYTTVYLIAFVGVHFGYDVCGHLSTCLMVSIAYLSTSCLNSEARSLSSRGRLDPWVTLASAASCLLLHAIFVYTSTQGYSVTWKAIPLGLQFIIMTLYFFTLRHKFLIVCGESTPIPRVSKDTEATFRLYFAGSGGHTGELLQMLTNSPPDDNIHRTWVICHADETSRQKIVAWEAERKSGKSLVRGYDIAVIRRARNVFQPWVTVPVSAIQCACDIYHVLNRGYPKGYPQVFVTNGPGTGLIIAGVAWIMKMLWLLPASSCKVLFIESIARVKSLSLTGKLFYYTGIATRMVTQHKPVGVRYGLEVEEMLTARVLDEPDSNSFSGF